MTRSIGVLRLDHRIFRDQRITSHVALAARAMGADIFSYSGEKDVNLEESLQDVTIRWGGKLDVQHIDVISAYIKNWNGILIHLTMYGESHHKTIETLSRYPNENLMIIVGGAKVPRFIYSLADFNTAVGWQPHSEVSAIGIFLYVLNEKNIMYSNFENADISINGSGSKSQRSGRF